MSQIQEFMMPVGRVLSTDDLEKWKISLTYEQIVNFIQTLSDSVKGCTNDIPTTISPSGQAMLDILSEVESIVQAHPVVKDKGSTRFGKVEFRDFYDELKEKSKKLLLRIPGLEDADKLSEEKDPRTELSLYFNESWGNRTRIDYGSGHELNFVAFLLCIKKLNLFTSDDYQTIVLKIFNKYIQIMRYLQKEYWLEPAGSHGVWGLDDYHFLPFLFGASQLATHKHLRPKSIHDPDMLEMFHSKYMYFECIYFINSIKTASLRWHSPMLDDISGVKTWSKVAEGMVKMYKAEVLGKLPIIQHFYFGSLLAAPENVSSPRVDENDACGHIHGHGEESTEYSGWADCCGIKVPSAVAASEMNKFMKPIPYD